MCQEAHLKITVYKKSICQRFKNIVDLNTEIFKKIFDGLEQSNVISTYSAYSGYSSYQL